MPNQEKKELIIYLENLLKERINNAQEELNSIIESRNNESKSSAGDKYETGRAMMQLAEQQAQTQLAKQHTILKQITEVKNAKAATKVELGSLVKTNNGDFYLAVGIGEVDTTSGKYICISPISPIGKAFRNKSAEETFTFMGKQYEIISIT